MAGAAAGGTPGVAVSGVAMRVDSAGASGGVSQCGALVPALRMRRDVPSPRAASGSFFEPKSSTITASTTTARQRPRLPTELVVRASTGRPPAAPDGA